MGGANMTASIAAFGSMQQMTTGRDDGPCHIEVRTTGPAVGVNAGTVTIAYGASQSITLVPNGQFQYANISPGFVYAPGSTVSISATGATVPAFTDILMFPTGLSLPSPTSLPTIS